MWSLEVWHKIVGRYKSAARLIGYMKVMVASERYFADAKMTWLVVNEGLKVAISKARSGLTPWVANLRDRLALWIPSSASTLRNLDALLVT